MNVVKAKSNLRVVRLLLDIDKVNLSMIRTGGHVGGDCFASMLKLLKIMYIFVCSFVFIKILKSENYLISIHITMMFFFFLHFHFSYNKKYFQLSNKT